MDDTNTNEPQGAQQALDSEGLDETGGRALLRRLRDQGFEADDLKLSVALGRPVEEVQGWMEGHEPPDDDIIMKARGIAKERGIEIE
ncbi:MAG TPA: hypothetical protein VER08_11530 [Pyrinomonadaceae bacterium]|nr:hypothetical protein [Pyrinomonadaceae bacterium]